MSPCLDLTNLRSMTDGDVEMERELFNEFYTSFELGLQTLQANCDAGNADVWRRTAHALKGMALNLGAESLGNICKTAQEDYQVDSGNKHALLGQMNEGYSAVKQFLNSHTVPYC